MQLTNQLCITACLCGTFASMAQQSGSAKGGAPYLAIPSTPRPKSAKRDVPYLATPSTPRPKSAKRDVPFLATPSTPRLNDHSQQKQDAPYLATDGALEGLVSRVGPRVYLQGAGAGEGLEADVAHMLGPPGDVPVLRGKRGRWGWLLLHRGAVRE